MTPGARIAAAISVLDAILAGQAAEQALTQWARNSRFAGSGDRAAVRDHVFDALRCQNSAAARGGSLTGRGVMIGLCALRGMDIDALFNANGHAPAELSPAERNALTHTAGVPDHVACDIPDWLWPQWQDSLGQDAIPVAMVQRERADVFLRVNQRRASIADAADLLAADTITTRPHPTVKTCLRVTHNPRRISHSTAYTNGIVELQDAASQRAVDLVDVTNGARLLDYCAGGGGKALAFADRYLSTVFAHDIAPQRMKDLQARAARAGVKITECPTSDLTRHAPFDVVFCDAPCSGSGTWRRTPEAKWRLTKDRLAELHETQVQILHDAAVLVPPSGILVYATCSVLELENAAVITRFVKDTPEFAIEFQDQALPGKDGDGFFLCQLRKN